MYPEQRTTTSLHAGHVGYVVLGMKTTRDAHIGDTFYHEGVPVPAFEGFQPAKSMVFAGLYPLDTNDYTKLQEALDRLTLNDASVSVARESSAALGQGFRLGFLGTLHMDVFRERLEEEYEATVINTAPTVPYIVRYTNGEEKIIRNPAEFPEIDEHARVAAFLEPMVAGTLIFPSEYLGTLMDLCGVRELHLLHDCFHPLILGIFTQSHRGEQQEYTYIDDNRYSYCLPPTTV